MADLEALSDLRTPWCLRVVVTLRIAEHMTAGTTATADLARTAGCDRIALGRVLGHLADRGVFDRAGEGEFALNDAARALLDPTLRIGLDLEGIGGRLALAWGTLPTYVRTGAPGYHEVFGMGFWDDLAANPEIGASFDALMGPAGHGPADPEFLVGEGWESVRHGRRRRRGHGHDARRDPRRPPRDPGHAGRPPGHRRHARPRPLRRPGWPTG